MLSCFKSTCASWIAAQCFKKGTSFTIRNGQKWSLLWEYYCYQDDKRYFSLPFWKHCDVWSFHPHSKTLFHIYWETALSCLITQPKNSFEHIFASSKAPAAKILFDRPRNHLIEICDSSKEKGVSFRKNERCGACIPLQTLNSWKKRTCEWAFCQPSSRFYQSMDPISPNR